MKKPESKVGFITDARSGIASAAPRNFAREGARVAIVEINAEADRNAC